MSLVSKRVQASIFPVKINAATNTAHTFNKTSALSPDSSELNIHTACPDDICISYFHTGTLDDHADTSPDFLPFSSEDSLDSFGTTSLLSLTATRGMIMENPMCYIGLRSEHLYIMDILETYIRYCAMGKLCQRRTHYSWFS